MNNVNLIGRLTSDPEIKELGNGVKNCNFSIAVKRDYKNADGEYESDFLRCVAWRNQAEFLGKYFAKGNQIGISGRLQNREWTDQNNNKRSQTEIIVENITFIESKKDSATPKKNGTQPKPTTPPSDMLASEADKENLPF